MLYTGRVACHQEMCHQEMSSALKSVLVMHTTMHHQYTSSYMQQFMYGFLWSQTCPMTAHLTQIITLYLMWMVLPFMDHGLLLLSMTDTVNIRFVDHKYGLGNTWFVIIRNRTLEPLWYPVIKKGETANDVLELGKEYSDPPTFHPKCVPSDHKQYIAGIS